MAMAMMMTGTTSGARTISRINDRPRNGRRSASAAAVPTAVAASVVNTATSKLRPVALIHSRLPK